MSLDYAADHLTGAVRSLATSEDPLAERLLSREQLVGAIEDLVSLTTKVEVANARASGDEQLATLADLA